jgi:multidrug efflux pump subunit AcrA (membrane-fusion protein)
MAERFRDLAAKACARHAPVFENDAHYLRPWTPAQVSLPNRQSTVSARVAEVLPQFDAATRTLKVRLEVANPGYVLRPAANPPFADKTPTEAGGAGVITVRMAPEASVPSATGGASSDSAVRTGERSRRPPPGARSRRTRHSPRFSRRTRSRSSSSTPWSSGPRIE